MSMFAGVIRLGDAPPPGRLVAHLKEQFPPPGWTSNSFEDERLVLLQATLSLLGAEEWREQEDCVVALAGDLVAPGCRPTALRCLAKAVRTSEVCALLRAANGTFVAVSYDKLRGRLFLASDALGARPLYYFIQPSFVAFSTSLASLRNTSSIALTPDLGAVAEQEALGYPLEGRTCFREVKVLKDNELLVVEGGVLSIRSYFDWSMIATDTRSEVNQLARDAANAVRVAVRDRIRSDKDTELSLLSGGLDSRVIVSELLLAGRPVKAINLSRKGSQDDLYASLYAKHAGIELRKVRWHPLLMGVNTGDTTARMLAAAVSPVSEDAVFSGDGGGETLGLLLLEPSTCNLLREGDLDEAVENHTHGYKPSERMLRQDAIAAMRGEPQRRLRKDLLASGVEDLEKALQLSVLRNDLRCHLHQYFEHITDTKVELLLPFYDRRVIEVVLRIPAPLHDHLHHRFYDLVLRQLGDDVRAVPWQVYPGRAPCPVPSDAVLPDQWSYRGWEFGDHLLSVVLHRLSRQRLAPALRLPVVLAAVALHRLRIRPCTTVFKRALNLSSLYYPVTPEEKRLEKW